MLYFVTTTFNEIPWHVGNDVPPGLSIKEVQADGHELELVRSLSDKIPQNGTKGNKWETMRVVNWTDFDAVNIYNMLLKT